MDIDTGNAIAFVLGGVVGTIWSLFSERKAAAPVVGLDHARPLPDNPALTCPPMMLAVGEESALRVGAITWTDEQHAEMFVMYERMLEVESRSLALFKSWLSPEQLSQFERESHIDVTGSDSGKTYQIRKGISQNVYELMPNGNFAQWCFVPEGNLATGDVMLAQKIALETMERKAMKVANRVPPYGLPVST